MLFGQKKETGLTVANWRHTGETMRYLIVLLLLAGCATREPVKLTTPDQVECGKKATALVQERYPGAELDAAGMPVFSVPMGDGFSAFAMYGTAFDRCMERRGGY
jgi:hypothetical protein